MMRNEPEGRREGHEGRDGVGVEARRRSRSFFAGSLVGSASEVAAACAPATQPAAAPADDVQYRSQPRKYAHERRLSHGGSQAAALIFTGGDSGGTANSSSGGMCNPSNTALAGDDTAGKFLFARDGKLGSGDGARVKHCHARLGQNQAARRLSHAGSQAAFLLGGRAVAVDPSALAVRREGDEDFDFAGTWSKEQHRGRRGKHATANRLTHSGHGAAAAIEARPPPDALLGSPRPTAGGSAGGSAQHTTAVAALLSSTEHARRRLSERGQAERRGSLYGSGNVMISQPPAAASTPRPTSAPPSTRRAGGDARVGNEARAAHDDIARVASGARAAGGDAGLWGAQRVGQQAMERRFSDFHTSLLALGSTPRAAASAAIDERLHREQMGAAATMAYWREQREMGHDAVTRLAAENRRASQDQQRRRSSTGRALVEGLGTEGQQRHSTDSTKMAEVLFNR